MKTFNRIWIGLVTGLAAPILTMIIVWKTNYKTLGMFEFFYQLDVMGVYTKLLSMCVLPNLIFFLFFIKKNYMASSRGVLFATFIYAAIVIILKYLI